MLNHYYFHIKNTVDLDYFALKYICQETLMKKFINYGYNQFITI